jgi:hypothetical protein
LLKGLAAQVSAEMSAKEQHNSSINLGSIPSAWT